jgi:nitrile hydratase subunit beta
MDGVDDVGGRQGFGPIDVTDADSPFHTDWEARAFGISKSVTSASGYSVDKFRYTREQLPPLEYLTSPYFEQWMRGAMAVLVGSGLVTPEELGAGRSNGSSPTDVGPPKSAEDAGAGTTATARFDGPLDGSPAFVHGNRVLVDLNAPRGHTRLPQYIWGRSGKVIAYHGAHCVPDDNVRNVKTFEPLYTVAFGLGDLFEEHQGAADLINVEIWERFLAISE